MAPQVRLTDNEFTQTDEVFDVLTPTDTPDYAYARKANYDAL